MLIRELTESETQRMLARRKQLVAAKNALHTGNLKDSIDLMITLLQMGFPSQGATAFFDRNERKVKAQLMSMYKTHNDLVPVYNIANDLAGIMNINWSWLYTLRQELKQKLQVH
jgi:hypothetical protein